MRLTRLSLLLLASFIIGGFALLSHYLLRDLEAQTLQSTEEAMVDAAHLFAALAEGIDPDDYGAVFDGIFTRSDEHQLQATIFHHTKAEVGIGLYITDKNGLVLYDSDVSLRSRVGQDLSLFRDVALTLKGYYGARSTRETETDKLSSYMYIGAPVIRDNRIDGVLTVYKAQQDVLPFIKQRKSLIRTSALMIAVGIVLFTGAVFVWLWQPVGRLTAYARAITQGKRPPFPRLGKGREVNTLGTALREMQESLEGRQYSEDYVRTLTHELKSPLAAIRGAAELLQEDMPLDQQKRFLSNIRQEAERSRALIDGLLKLSSIEGQSSLKRKQSLRFDQLIENVLGQFTERLSVTGQSFNVQLEELNITGDSEMLRLAVSNLIQNAIAFGPPGSAIGVSLTNDETGIVLTITDSGPGIPDYAKDRIFERFYSLDRPNRPASKSTGLGLAFVKETAKLHDGSISLSSEDGTTQAILSLPH